MATIVIKASGIVRAAAYIAKMDDASVGVAPVGRMSSGFMSPAMENPLRTQEHPAHRSVHRAFTSTVPGILEGIRPGDQDETTVSQSIHQSHAQQTGYSVRLPAYGI